MNSEKTRRNFIKSASGILAGVNTLTHSSSGTQARETEKASTEQSRTIEPDTFEHSSDLNQRKESVDEAIETYRELYTKLSEDGNPPLHRVDKMDFDLENKIIYWNDHVERLHDLDRSADTTVPSVHSRNKRPFNTILSKLNLVEDENVYVDLVAVDKMPKEEEELESYKNFTEKTLDNFFSQLNTEDRVHIDVNTRSVDGREEIRRGFEEHGTSPRAELNKEFRNSWYRIPVYLMGDQEEFANLGSYDGDEDAATMQIQEELWNGEFDGRGKKYGIVHEICHALSLDHNPYDGRIYQSPHNKLKAETLVNGDVEYEFVTSEAVAVEDFDPGKIEEGDAIEEFLSRNRAYIQNDNWQSLDVELKSHQMSYRETEEGYDVAEIHIDPDARIDLVIDQNGDVYDCSLVATRSWAR